jgi:hypothetical protein
MNSATSNAVIRRFGNPLETGASAGGCGVVAVCADSVYGFPPIPAVRLADRSIHPRVVHVVQVRSMVEAVGYPREFPIGELAEESADRVSVRDACEGGVLTRYAHARVEHHGTRNRA